MLSTIDKADVCFARDNALSQGVNIDSRKRTVNHSLQILKWLIDATPSLVGWKSNGAAKLASLDDSFDITVVQMVDGKFWKKQLSGWKEVGAALVALFALINNGEITNFASYIVDRCKHENDDLHKRMHQRELRYLADGEDPPTLESVERRDVSAEAKWRATHAFLKDSNLKDETNQAICALQQAVHSGDPPRAVLEMLKKLPKPPGYTTLEERQEEERLMRARALAEDEDF